MKLNNYKVARIIMVLSIILAILIGNYRSVSTETNKVIQVFEVGESKDGLSARNDLTDRCNDAMNLITLAKRYGADYAQLEHCVTTITTQLDHPTTPKAIQSLYLANRETTTYFNLVYTFTEEKIMQSAKSSKENDLRLLKGLYDDFHSSANILSRSDYNKYANEYNQTLQSFPNNILSFVNRVKPLPIFGE